jgi:ABC-type nickel/cobalt efflux system permease component RcnA
VNGLLLLAGTAAGVGVVHTLLGPDHYLPFVVLGRARGWSTRRTAGVTLTCGLAHVASALLLGLGGIALGVAVSRMTHLEELRGSLTAWLLISVGLVYGAWGLRRALRGERHVHVEPEPIAHAHPHDHHHPHGHAPHHGHPHSHGEPEQPREWRSLTPWVLFVVFVLGPCEPLIPLVMVPAAAGSVAGVVVVSVVFSLATLVAMLAAVTVGRHGLDLLPLGRLERYTHAFAGAAIFVSGVGIRLLGW